MKEYPSIPSAADLLARRPEYLGRPFVAFEKLDGSNIRAEWDRKKGWHLFGSRHRPLDASHPELGRAVGLVLAGYGEALAKALTDDPAFHGAGRATAYFEYLGPHSFAGMHAPADLRVASNEPMRVVLIDLNLHKRGLVGAETFIARLGHLGIPRVVHRGALSPDFIAEVRAGAHGGGEGVLLKGGEGHARWMAKVKTDAYLARLKAAFGAGWERHWE